MNEMSKRNGPGRKPAPPLLRKERVNLKLPRWLLDWLESERARESVSLAVLIEQALSKVHGLKAPK